MSVFVEKIRQACLNSRSLLCVGLDPDPDLMPVPDVFEFNKGIVDATAGAVSAYKPNLAFYEALGTAGMKALEDTIAHIRNTADDAIIIGDAKRGDIGPSARAYAKAMFSVWDFDAITANAWGGADSIEPLVEDGTRGVFVWCRGSNPGSADFQDIEAGPINKAVPLYQRMALACSEWNTRGNIGLVVGATVPEQLASVRELCPEMPLLIPGVGAQGGDLEAAVRAGADANGRLALVNSSRGVIYASCGRDFAAAAGKAARTLRDSINAVLAQEGLDWPSS